MSKRLFTDNQEKQICKLYLEDRLSTHTLAKQFLCSFRTIKLVIERNGFKLRSLSEAGKGKFGEKCSNWKGGKKHHRDGYVWTYKPDHPNADKKGYVFEHRLVIEKYWGRFLNPEEVVHHINGDPSDNRIENLKLFTKNKDHLSWHEKIKKETKLLQKEFYYEKTNRA